MAQKTSIFGGNPLRLYKYISMRDPKGYEFSAINSYKINIVLIWDVFSSSKPFAVETQPYITKRP